MEYYFKVILHGRGKNPDEAWADATENFVVDPGPTPDIYYEEEEA